MSNKATRRSKSRRNRRILVALVAISLVLILVLAYFISQHSTTPLAASNKYFAISDLAATYEAVISNATGQNPGSAVRIQQFGFNFTPVDGDATGVRIFASGNLDPLQNNWEGETIPNGTSTFSGEMMPQFPIPSYRQADGTYTLTIRIACQEADGSVTLHFIPGGVIGYLAGAGWS